MKTTASLLASIAAIGFATPALAEGKMSNQDIQEKFQSLDTNKNGSLTQAEFTAGGKSAEEFAAADSDRNGSLTVTELKTYKDQKWNESNKSGMDRSRSN